METTTKESQKQRDHQTVEDEKEILVNGKKKKEKNVKEMDKNSKKKKILFEMDRKNGSTTMTKQSNNIYTTGHLSLVQSGCLQVPAMNEKEFNVPFYHS